MSFFLNPRATSFYLAPAFGPGFAVTPRAQNCSGGSCGVDPREFYYRQQQEQQRRRAFDSFFVDAYLAGLIDSDPFFNSRWFGARFGRPDADPNACANGACDCDGMDVDCCGGDGQACCSPPQRHSVPVSKAGGSSSSAPAPSDNDNKAETSASSSSSSSTLANVENPWASSLSSFISDENDVKVDDGEDLVTVSSSWAGFDKGDLSVDFEDGSLLIRGKQRAEKRDERTGAVSRSSREVSRFVALPRNVDREAISAKFKDGQLTIEVPKVKPSEKKSETIVID